MANREFLRKDRELLWELDQITNAGPNWREAGAAPVAGQGAEAGAAGGGFGGASAFGGGAERTPPEFGPAPGDATGAPAAGGPVADGAAPAGGEAPGGAAASQV